jgi:hypothetical protein
MGIAPQNPYPEAARYTYERTLGQNFARQGPQRFQEGLETDIDIPTNFAIGANPPMDLPITHRKTPQETTQERMHAGSASWILAPTFLGEFAAGAGEIPQTYYNPTRVNRHRPNPVTVEG